MGAVGRSNLLQLIVGSGVIAQANPALGSLQAGAVGWVKRLHTSHLTDLPRGFCRKRAWTAM